LNRHIALRLLLAFDTLGKAAAKEIVKERDTRTVDETHKASVEGAKVAGRARQDLEKQLGRPVAFGELLAQAGKEGRAAGAQDRTQALGSIMMVVPAPPHRVPKASGPSTQPSWREAGAASSRPSKAAVQAGEPNF
jgi:hypothetical protein